MKLRKASKKATIPHEIIKTWWWRRLVFVRFDEETHTTQWKHFVPEYPSFEFSNEWNMWHRKDELLAFRYELLRRVLQHSDLPEWHALPAWLNAWISGVLSHKRERAVCGVFSPTAPKGYVSLGSWVWDLTASDDALCKHFLMHINGERRKNGLPDTGDPFYGIGGKKLSHSEKRRGQRNRSVSWMAVETYDLQKHQIRPLTDGERSRLSKARREIAAFETTFISALDDAKRSIPEGQRSSNPGTMYSTFIEENFKKLIASRLSKK